MGLILERDFYVETLEGLTRMSRVPKLVGAVESSSVRSISGFTISSLGMLA